MKQQWILTVEQTRIGPTYATVYEAMHQARVQFLTDWSWEPDRHMPEVFRGVSRLGHAGMIHR